MTRWRGSIIRQPNLSTTPGYSDFYRVVSDTYSRWSGSMKICAGSAYEVLGGCHDDVPECCAWGYFGFGPRLTAAYLIASAMYGEGRTNSCWLNKFEKAEAAQYVDAFTEEVVMHWGDTWEITDDEILQWINKHNNKPKEDSHEREAETTAAGQQAGPKRRGVRQRAIR